MPDRASIYYHSEQNTERRLQSTISSAAATQQHLRARGGRQAPRRKERQPSRQKKAL
ncbi:hypothetical protein PF010_g19714 [Phytophthora fragariae]|nr:hypothetical protein PR001_g32220 [Phytophthora rubi]KAE9087470.1 hypothetical protein PF010_g19714 [Phytophthora fragariae]KAE8955196.1 hypothetical protein PR002_g31852 [Phytophthora rubi]KAE9198475.1 hypothetical protein PF004_g19534 [Phytophthora fragariae]KAE9263176.1 hypothetical protein PR003_g33252 [Phytophthora rubi]